MIMANWTGVITNAGNDVLSEWVNEKTLNFDSAAAGQGTVATAGMLAQTALVNQKQIASIIAADRVGTGIRLKIRITAPQTAYTLNQYGVWASVTGGSSTMIALFQHEGGISIPSATESPDFVYTFYALISTSNTGEWTVNIDTSALVTLDDVATAIATAVATKEGLIKNATIKNSIADADAVAVVDSADDSKTKRVLWSTIKSALGQIFVPLTRKINNKALSSDITLTGEDIKTNSTDNTPIGDVVSVLGGATTPQGALAALGAGVRPNLLDNAYFVGGGTGWGVFPVNQRGVSGTISTPGYFIDRWKLISGTVQITAAGLVSNGTIAQILPASIGSVYTATALTTTGLVTCQYDDTSRTFTITGTGQTFIFAKLEKGTAQTLAYQDADGAWRLLPQPDSDYVTQLLRCQQYLFDCGNTLENFPAIMNGTWGSATVQIPIPMVKTPVLSKKSSRYGVIYTSTGALGVTNATVHYLDGNHATISLQTESSVVSNCVWRECAFWLDTGM